MLNNSNNKKFLLCIPDTLESITFIEEFKKHKIPIIILAKKKWMTNLSSFKEINVIFSESEDILKIIYCIQSYLTKNNYSLNYAISFSEKNVEIVAKIREHFNLPGINYSDSLYFRDKGLMKDKATSYDILCPNYYYKKPGETIEDFKEFLFLTRNKKKLSESTAFLVKPKKAWGGQGISKISSLEEAIKFYKENESDIENYIFEKYIDGQLIHIGGLIKDGFPYQIAYACHINSIFEVYNSLGKKHMCMISINPEGIYSNLSDFIKKIIKVFINTDSLFEIELFKDKKTGKLYFCEIAIRPATAKLTWLQETVTGFNPYRLYAIILINKLYNKNINIPNEIISKKQFAGIVGIVPTKGRLEYFTKVKDLNHLNFEYAEQNCKLGDIYQSINFNNNLGWFCFKSPTYNQTLKKAKSIIKSFRFKVNPVNGHRKFPPPLG